MKQLLTYIYVVLTASVFAQAPQSIPYQAVVRNPDGFVMANTAMTITFKIHDSSATGTVVYEENHAATSNSQGLISLNVGNGSVVSGTFSGINWGAGSKFLHVLMNAGSGVVDLGTQQMMSVPYTLYAENTVVRISNSGDTLTIGGNSVIVPGISSANPQPLYVQGQGVTDVDGNFYPSIIINGQEWMQKNLAVSKYRNGEFIQTDLDNNFWASPNSGAYAIYSNDISKNELYGKLYNFFCVEDSRGICPNNWHIPTKGEWNLLINYLDGNMVAGGKMKSLILWDSPNIGANNICGFSALPGGRRFEYGGYMDVGSYAYWWTTNTEGSSAGYYKAIYSNGAYIGEGIQSKNAGYSIRCIKD